MQPDCRHLAAGARRTSFYLRAADKKWRELRRVLTRAARLPSDQWKVE
ncbi:hypothetical protein GSH05_17045 [Burkholderia pseudomallei]|nr:hypothetical protein [Burkholderia pseudomallei]MWA34887.1 hypothetical protein [Burkholderia pseudomallei]